MTVTDNADLVPYNQQKGRVLTEDSAYVAFWAMNLDDLIFLNRPTINFRHTTIHQYISHVHHRLSESINTESAYAYMYGCRGDIVSVAMAVMLGLFVWTRCHFIHI